MKVGIASESENENSEVSVKAGRAPYYLIFEDKKLIEVIKNPFAVGGGGAGWSVAYMLAKKDINLVIAGRIGPNMQTALKEKGIKFKEQADKKIKEIIKEI